MQNKRVSDARLKQATLLTGELNAITFASHEAHAINAKLYVTVIAHFCIDAESISI